MWSCVLTPLWACTWWAWAQSLRSSPSIWTDTCCSRWDTKCRPWVWSAAPPPPPPWWRSTEAAGCCPHTPTNTWRVRASLLQHPSITDFTSMTTADCCFCSCSRTARLCGCGEVRCLQSAGTLDDYSAETTESGVEVLHSSRGGCLGLCIQCAWSCWWVSSMKTNQTQQAHPLCKWFIDGAVADATGF